MNKNLFAEAGRFLSVGVVNTAIGLLVIYFAKWFLQFGDVAANALGYAIGFLISFTLNSRWTFTYRGPLTIAFAKFMLVVLVAYGMNLLMVISSINILGLNSYLAQTLGVPIYTATTYVASKYLVFRSKNKFGGL